MPLTRVQRDYLDWVETTKVWENASRADIKANLARLQGRYQMPDVTMAAFLLEMSGRIQTGLDDGNKAVKALAQDPEHPVPQSVIDRIAQPILDEVSLVRAEMLVMAAVLTRKQRGKPPY